MQTQTNDKYGNSRIAIADLEYIATSSQYTNCYGVTILLDGKRVGIAANQGSGGSTILRPATYGEEGGLDEAMAYAKTLPPVDISHLAPTVAPLPMTLDLLIDCLVEDALRPAYRVRTAARLNTSKEYCGRRGVSVKSDDSDRSARCTIGRTRKGAVATFSIGEVIALHRALGEWIEDYSDTFGGVPSEEAEG
jgi:hypothetical protein